MKPAAIVILLLSVQFASAQNFSDLNYAQLNKPEDFKRAEIKVKDCSTFLLSNPVMDKDDNWHSAAMFLVRWMTGTPDYSFSIEGFTAKLSKDNPSLMGVYMAAMCSYAMKNKEAAKNNDSLQLHSIKTFITYCKNPANKVKSTKAIKELFEADENNTLDAYRKEK